MLLNIVNFLGRIFMKTFFFMEVRGKENLPENGPLMICANHKSMWDPVAISAFLKYDISFMAKDSLFKNKLIGSFLRSLKAFPVKRGEGDFSSIKTVLKIFKSNSSTMIFPEGTRVKKGEAVEPKNGAVWLASMAGVPILPIFIKGDYKLFGKMQLIIGKPIDMGQYKGKKLTTDELNSLSAELMNTIYSL